MAIYKCCMTMANKTWFPMTVVIRVRFRTILWPFMANLGMFYGKVEGAEPGAKIVSSRYHKILRYARNGTSSPLAGDTEDAYWHFVQNHITVTSQWARWRLKYPWLDCLLNRLFWHRSKKTPKLRATGPLWGESTGDRWILLIMGQ